MSAFRNLILVCWVGAIMSLAQGQAPAGTLPTVISSPANVAMLTGSTSGAIDLSAIFGLPGVAGPLVQMQTILGGITIELYPQSAPLTVANFLEYVNGGLYNNIIINRSVPSFVIQGGAYTVNSAGSPVAILNLGTVVNETQLSNVRGTLAMARTSDPNSASNQWFINLANNGGAPNNLDTTTGGYTVFARVIGTGMTVADAIATLKVYALDTGDFANTPLYNVSATATTVAYANWVRLPSVTAIPIYPTGTGALSALGFSVSSSNSAVVSASIAGQLLYLNASAAGSAAITLTATDNSGNQTSATFTAVVSGLTQQPVSQTVETGSTAVFSVGVASGVTGTTYQWKLNGVAIAGATSARLVVSNAAAANVGSYTCVVASGGATITSNAATLALSAATDAGRLINLSVLTTDVTPSQSLTLGFVIGGNTPNEPLLLRASGPGLKAFSLTSPLLPDPLLTLYNSSSVALASNSGWSGTTANQTAVTAADAATGAFALTPGSLDSAMVQTLSPGSGSAGYSIIISGKSGDGGTTLGEVFDDTPSGTFTVGATHLKNLSSRLALQTGDTLTAGFTVGGQTSKTVLIRAVGPGLSAFGIPGVMPDPQLMLFSSGTVISANAGWGSDSQIISTAAAVGAFALTPGSNDSVILTTLAPGGYSAQVNSVSGAGGAALVEVYEVP